MVDRCTSGARECTSAASSSALRCPWLSNRALSSSLRAGVARPPCRRTRAITSSTAWRSAASLIVSCFPVTGPGYSAVAQLQILAIASRAGRRPRPSSVLSLVGGALADGCGLAGLPLLLELAEVPHGQGDHP